MTEELSVGERMREAFGGIDMKSAMRLAFGKCPHCGEKLVRGHWLRWCADRTCIGYVGPLNKALGNRIEAAAPKTPEEQKVIKQLAEMLEIDTR